MMGNKSKRRQCQVPILDNLGFPCGCKQVDAGYSGNKNERHFRKYITKVATDFKTSCLLRREARRARRKGNVTSQHEQPAEAGGLQEVIKSP